MSHGAQAWHGTHHHRGHIADQNRRAATAAHHNAANVIGIAQQTNATDGELLRALGHVAAAGIGVAPGQGVQQLLVAELVGLELVQIGLHLVLLDKPAHGHHIGHPGHLAQGAFDHPVLQSAQLGGRHAVPAQAIAHDFTHRRGIGRNIGLYTGGQIHPAQPLIDLLARQIDRDTFVIGDDGEGQAKLGVREQADRTGQARQGDFQGKGDLLFDLFCSAARVQRDHRHLCVCDVGKRFHR